MKLAIIPCSCCLEIRTLNFHLIILDLSRFLDNLGNIVRLVVRCHKGFQLEIPESVSYDRHACLSLNKRDAGSACNTPTPLNISNLGELPMPGTNLAQHEQHLKSLESSLTEICKHHHQALGIIKESWDTTLNLFIVIERLRKTSLLVGKEEQ